MLQDLRFALRLFRKHPAPVGISVGGLALAISVVTGVFSLVNASMLRPYGMDDPSSVVTVALPNHGGWSHWTYSRFLQMREGSTLSTVEAALPDRVRFSTAAATDGARDRPILFVSGGYLPTLGGRTSRGRTLGPSDDRPGAPAVIVVSDHFWQTALTGDPAVVGKTVWLNDSPVIIVGVMHAEFTGPVQLRPSMWATFAVAHAVLGGLRFDATTRTHVEVIARLGRGATLQAAQDNLTAAVRHSNAPGSTPAAAPSGPAAQLFRVASPIDRPDDAESVFVIASTLGAVGLVLALACANTANLLMAAAVTRRREIGVRLALGAAPRRLLRQMISESLLLGGLSAGFGFVLAMWLAPLLRSMVQMSPEIDTAPDGRVVLFTVAVALVCGAGCGLAPARHGVRGSVLSALQARSGARGAGMPSRSRTWFVGFQVAVSMLLLVVAALLARTAVAKTHADIGFDADRLLAVSVDMPRTQFDERMYLRVALDAVRAVPAVERASMTQYPPLGGTAEHSRFTFADRSCLLQVNRTDVDYLATMGVRVVRGRAFTGEEVAREAPIVLISASAARAFFGEADAVGQSLSHVSTEGGSDAPMVIGVVTDALTDRLRPDSSGAIYQPISLQRLNPAGLIVRTANPGLAARAVEEALRRIDPRVQPETWRVREKLDALLSGTQMLAWVTGPVAVLAFLLAGLGVYGVTSFIVSERREEVSVRLAIGASAGDVLRLLVKDGLRPVISGLVVGLAAALVIGRLLARSLGISPYDPVAIGIATTTLLVGAFIAVIVPARRAAQADPASVLR
jgi:predicted permease